MDSADLAEKIKEKVVPKVKETILDAMLKAEKAMTQSLSARNLSEASIF